MTDAIPPIKVSIVADTSGLKTGVDQATEGIKNMESSVKTASNGMSSFVGRLKQVGQTLGVVFAAQQAIQFGKDIIMAASDMNETLSKTQIIFGDAFTQIDAFSNKAATSMGMSKQAALDASSTFALFGQSAGLSGGKVADFSTSMVQLSADFASFYNTSPEEAITAIGAAFRGENEPIRKYNILLDDASTRQEALRLGIVKTTTQALTPQQRVLAVQSLILKQSTVAQGDYARTAEGAANTMRTLSAQFADAKVKLGDALMPLFRAFLGVLKTLIPVLTVVGNFFSKYSSDIMALAKVVGIAAAVFYGYRAAMLVTAATTTFLQVVTTLMKGAQLASIASTNGLAASMLVLNAVMRANPFGLILTAITLVIGVVVLLWKHSDGFRKLVIMVAKTALMAFSSIIPIVGRVGEAIIKLLTTPARKFLELLSKLPGVGKYAKAALDFVNGAIDKTSDFADSAAKKAKELADKLDGMGKSAKKAGEETKKAVAPTTGGAGAGGGGKGGIDDKTKKKLDDLVKKAVNIQKDIQDAIDEANDKALEALNARNEKMAEANQNYLERETELRKNYDEAMAEAQKTYDEKILDINKTYDAKEIDLLKAKNAKIVDLQTKAEEQTTKLIQSAADKRQSIIQQSIDRLRNAFASKTGFDIADAFGAGATTGKTLLSKLQNQLKGTKDLQANAGKLAAAGYSQTFIEQIVKQGPEIGNQIAQALQDSTPEEVKALQDSFVEMEKIQNSGLDSLAASMNSGARLATDELRKAYDQVAIDLKDALKTVDDELKKGMAEANANYQEAMTQTKVDRDEALADALKTFTEAKAKAQKTLDEGLAEAQRTLQDALIKAQKEYEKAIDDINKATAKKIDDLKVKLAEVVALIAAISAAQASAITSQTPVYTPVVASATPSTTGTGGVNNTTNITNNVTGYNLSDPNQTAAQMQSYIKYGQVVQIPAATATIGLSAAQKGQLTVFE